MGGFNMDQKTAFGKQIMTFTATTGQTLKKRLLFLLPALVFVAAGVFALVSPELLEDSDASMVLLLFFGAGALFLLMGILFVKPSKAVLYEGGFVLTRGTKVTETGFSDLKGIIDSTTVTKLYGAIPLSQTRLVIIHKKNDEKFGATKATVPSFNQFADELGTAVSKYLLKDVTKDNIEQLSILFGDKLELTGGRFIHDAGKEKGMVSIPADAVRSAEYIGSDGYWIALKGQCDENGKAEELASIRADKALNLESLCRIIEMLS